jgi:general secretion pathway protein A
MLASAVMKPLRQRIALEHHVQPIQEHEVTSYLSHRIQVAGGTYAEIFAPGVEQMFYEFSNGCPRLLNLLADRVLLAAYSKEMKPVLPELVEKKAIEMAAQSYAQTIATDDELGA